MAEPIDSKFITLVPAHGSGGDIILEEVKPQSPKQPRIPFFYTQNSFGSKIAHTGKRRSIKPALNTGIRSSAYNRKSDLRINIHSSPRVPQASKGVPTVLPITQPREQDINAIEPPYDTYASTMQLSPADPFFQIPVYDREDQITTPANNSTFLFPHQQSLPAGDLSPLPSDNPLDLCLLLSPLSTLEGSKIPCAHELHFVQLCKHCGYLYFPSNGMQLDLRETSQQDHTASSGQYVEVVEPDDLTASHYGNSISQAPDFGYLSGPSMYAPLTVDDNTPNNFPMNSSGPTMGFCQDQQTIPSRPRLTIPDNSYRDYPFPPALSTSVSSAGSSMFFPSPASAMTPDDYPLTGNPVSHSESTFY